MWARQERRSKTARKNITMALNRPKDIFFVICFENPPDELFERI